MAYTSLTPEELAELHALRAELPKAELRAVKALRTPPPGHALEGEAVARFEDADKEVAQLRRRIKELESKK